MAELDWGGLHYFWQAEGGIRDLVRSRGLGDVYKRQVLEVAKTVRTLVDPVPAEFVREFQKSTINEPVPACLLYTSDAADERSSVDLGGRRIIKKNNRCRHHWSWNSLYTYLECSVTQHTCIQ